MLSGKVDLKRVVCLFIIILTAVQPALAHVRPGELLKLLQSSAAFQYLCLGYQHILPYGFDHILFILSLFLLSPRLKPVLWQATAFTVAHSITLGLAMYHVFTPPAGIVEPVIAISILYVAIENIFSSKLRPSRIGIVFLFGLVHGMGFAGVLSQLGLPQNHYFTCLVLFNLGVELGQVTVIIAAWLLLARWFGHQPHYRKFIVIPLSVIIALVALFWTIQRVFL